jgi:hypothetical protein
VLVKLNPLSSAVNQTLAKLMLRWSEAPVVAEFLSPVTVQLVDPVTGLPMRKSHISQLKRKILLVLDPSLSCCWECHSGYLRAGYAVMQPVETHRTLSP